MSRAIDLVKDRIPKGGFCIDVGANTGRITETLLEMVGPEGKVIAVEPSGEALVALRELQKQYPNLQVEDCALSSYNGRAIGYRDLVNIHDSRYNTTYKAKGSAEIADDIPCKTLDTLVQLEGEVDFISLDCQGSCYEIFLGMKNLLARQKKLKLFSFFWPEGLEQCGAGQYNARTYLDDLMRHGFMVRELDKVTGSRRRIEGVDFFLRKYEHDNCFIYAEKNEL